jgi:tetratricopeptide (TPR) repeat protein
LALDPNYGDARINRSILLRRRGELVEARAELVAATNDPRADGTAWLQLAILDLESGRPGQALAELETAHKQLGDRTDVLNALGESYSRLNDRKKALEALKKSLSINPDQPSVSAAVAYLDKQE